MNENKTAMWSGGSAGIGAFLAAILPPAWPWYYELAVVLRACVVMYFAAKFFGPGSR